MQRRAKSWNPFQKRHQRFMITRSCRLAAVFVEVATAICMLYIWLMAAVQEIPSGLGSEMELFHMPLERHYSEITMESKRQYLK